MQKVLLIGHTGQLGSAIDSEFKKDLDSYEVVGMNSKDIDIRSVESIQLAFKKHKPDILINTAAYTDVNKSELNPVPAYEMNTFAVGNLADVCINNGTIFVHISTDYVFGSRQMRVLTEYDDPNPLNNYGASKLSGELILKNKMTYSSVPWYIVRTSSLYGENANKEKGTFLLNALQKIKSNNPMYLNNLNLMSPTYVGHVAIYIKNLLKKEKGLYHSANFGVASPYDFIKTAVDIINNNKLAEGYSYDNLILNNEGQNHVNRPRFSFLGSEKNIGYAMPNWDKALIEFLVNNKGML